MNRLAVRGESRTRTKARDFSSDQGAEPQEYREYFKVGNAELCGKDPLSARRDFHHGLLTYGLLVGAVTLASTAAAQERPDFSGQWTVVPAPGAPTPAAPALPGGGSEGGRAPLPPDMGSGFGSPITIAQDANGLTVQYAFFVTGDRQPPLKFAYAFGGAETRNSVMMGRGLQEQRARTEWNGERLILTTVHTFVDPSNGGAVAAEARQALSLESPTSLLVETTRVGVLGGPTTTTKTRYVRSTPR